MKEQILRYTRWDRTNHWLVAILFLCAGLSGLALFHPWLFGLSGLFGGGTWTRILHPIFGVAMFILFLLMAVRFAGHNLLDRNDRQWLKQINDVVANREERLPEVGRYNGGQKVLFWILVLCLLVLLVTGILMWQEFFGDYFPVMAARWASLLHAFAAFVLILSIIVHVYSGIWVKGSMYGMFHGWVSRAWARKHHLAWYRQVSGEPVNERERTGPRRPPHRS